MTNGKLDLGKIEQCLRAVQADLDRISRTLTEPREPLEEAMIRNMLDGYAYVDELVARGIDALALGNAHVFLEMNARVVCGIAPAERAALGAHFKATEERFYDQPGGGIEALIEWLKRHANDPVERRAAGAFVEVMSEPQLFIEGNHRTGALIMSYLLAREGRPPFVLCKANAAAFFTTAAAITRQRRNGLSMLFAAPRLRREIALLMAVAPDGAPEPTIRQLASDRQR